MELKFKKLSLAAEIPETATKGAAGLDLVAISKAIVKHPSFGQDIYVEYDTGLAVAIPEGYVGLLFQRSSVSNYSLILANAVGVIDSDYRGPIKLRFKRLGAGKPEYNIGDKVGQLVLVQSPKISALEVQELSNTERGDGGFGSTGN